MASSRQQVDNSMIEDGYQYLYRHQILELFEDLCTQLIYERPPDIKSYLIQALKDRKNQGPAGHAVFTDSEIKNIYMMFDLKQEKNLNREQCKEALRTISNSVYQHDKVERVDIPDSVDIILFKKLVMAVLG
ncbi:hypothetical protein SteCoe_18337 [Stentor coeruleus]|uniref:EF-hand domain-containing protein n=1 Tax=Stentor coeruleus TaxID=5963 RepID=A0A1R2BWR7_9CILI|nr:hypothetical protein SteCoe_18337 [Stentor coeruleus]